MLFQFNVSIFINITSHFQKIPQYSSILPKQLGDAVADGRPDPPACSASVPRLWPSAGRSAGGSFSLGSARASTDPTLGHAPPLGCHSPPNGGRARTSGRTASPHRWETADLAWGVLWGVPPPTAGGSPARIAGPAATVTTVTAVTGNSRFARRDRRGGNGRQQPTPRSIRTRPSRPPAAQPKRGRVRRHRRHPGATDAQILPGRVVRVANRANREAPKSPNLNRAESRGAPSHPESSLTSFRRTV